MSGKRTQRDQRILEATTDRLFSPERDATRVDMSVDFRTPGRPFRSVLNWLQRDAFRGELERQLSLAAERLASKPRAPLLAQSGTDNAESENDE
jgi:hypothetical protein